MGQAATRLILNGTHLKDDDSLRSDPLTEYRSSDESRKDEQRATCYVFLKWDEREVGVTCLNR